jgi:hypothetical protein
VVRGKLKARDPFELIRWLAYSQPDPRKALAELVQNSLDAQATRIRVSRIRERGTPCLKLFDDGIGVIPEMDRRDALQYIATNIGHSRKRRLSPEERLALMTQGQYGIGLLGFWSLGETLEMRSSVPGHVPHRLVLRRDRPDYTIEPLRGRLAVHDRWTEVVVVGLHREAASALHGRRAADYLAAELRGQLLSREVDLRVEDRMSRGRAQKVIAVRPPRFLGERLDGLGPIEVPGHPPIRLEVYVSRKEDGADSRGLAVYAAGTLVASGFGELGAIGLDRPPWTDARLTGIVDFPGFRVAPGSRRGVIPDEAAGAFAQGLTSLEPILRGILESFERRLAEELDRTLVRDLKQAFRDFYRQRPRYSMLPVRAEETGGPVLSGEGDRDGNEAGEEENPAMGVVPPGVSEPTTRGRAVDLLPPGPLARVQLDPAAVRLACGAARRIRALALDAVGRQVEETVTFAWSVVGPVGTLNEIDGRRDAVQLQAAEDPGEGAVRVRAGANDREASAEAEVQILDAPFSGASEEGIPEPELVSIPGESWRSRVVDGRWQVNAAHRDFRSVADQPPLKLRYLAMLFSKEVVLRSSQDPRFERPLEQLVEVASYADRKIAERRRGRRIVRKDAE